MSRKTVYWILSALVVWGFIPAGAYAASLSALSSAGRYTVGETFVVTVMASSDVAFNAVGGKLTFSTGDLRVISVSTAGSVLRIWARDPSFSNADGTVSFEGVVPNPGYAGTGKIISVSFRALREGATPIGIADGEVLANDGKGTQLFDKSFGLQLQIEKAPIRQTPTPVQSPLIASPVPSGTAWAAPESSTTPSPGAAPDEKRIQQLTILVWALGIAVILLIVLVLCLCSSGRTSRIRRKH